MQYESISFDENDQNLFQVDDARLRADALKHSVLPRLRMIMNECISLISQIYSIEALDDSTIAFSPHFRQKRDKELTLLYDLAFVGLSGKGAKNKWLGVERKDGKPVQALPFQFGFQLMQNGLTVLFNNYWLKGLSDASFKRYLNFHLEFEALSHRLCYWCGMEPLLFYGGNIGPLSTFKQHYRFMIDSKLFDNSFISRNSHDFPISSASIEQLAVDYVFFYPIYDSYIRISKGEPVRFLELIEKANDWLITAAANHQDEPHRVAHDNLSQEVMLQAKEAAEKRVKVMPSIRWRVFQRDDWRCVSCGKGSPHGAILQVDHIIPRSKGGEDALENYQTLCSLCNIGKSNRDDTDLRW